jgi:segregation and condensation protein B
MSLKAKLEAVIYAAEEPVTLAQLATLFASEAEEWKRAQTSQSEQAPEAEPEAAESDLGAELAQLGLEGALTDPLTPEILTPGIVDPPPVEPILDPLQADPASDSPVQTADEAEPGDAGHAVGEDAPASPDNASVSASAELEFRRLARLREREIRATLREILDELIADYASDDRGIEIREIAGGFRMATKPECHDAVRMFVKSLKPALKLSLPALETLAVIAYKQPVTAPEVNEIRGVDSSGVFGSLLARKLIVTAGRKQVIGRPILYKTTREFLMRFGLKDVAELPSMEEFEKMAAIELDEPETLVGAEPESGARRDSSADRDPDPNLSLEFEEDAAEDPTDGPSDAAQETTETQETAETAASTESPTPDEAAPAAPPAIEQAETETSLHGEEEIHSKQ